MYFGGPADKSRRRHRAHQLHASSKSGALPTCHQKALQRSLARTAMKLSYWHLKPTSRSLGYGASADFVKSPNFVNEALFKCAHITACNFENPNLHEGWTGLFFLVIESIHRLSKLRNAKRRPTCLVYYTASRYLKSSLLQL